MKMRKIFLGKKTMHGVRAFAAKIISSEARVRNKVIQR